MKKQTYLLGVVLFISFFLSCKHHEKKVDQDYIRPVIKENFIPFVYGIDISHHQNNEIDFISKTSDSLSFVICKATEGVTYTEPPIFKELENNRSTRFYKRCVSLLSF